MIQLIELLAGVRRSTNGLIRSGAGFQRSHELATARASRTRWTTRTSSPGERLSMRPYGTDFEESTTTAAPPTAAVA
jgi:hypothetical protein